MIIPRVSTKQAIDFLKLMKKLFLDNSKFDTYRILTDMNRFELEDEDDENSQIVQVKTAGAVLVQELRKRGYENEVMIFTSNGERALATCKELGFTKNIKATGSTEECYEFCHY